jgi:hypothetical protein
MPGDSPCRSLFPSRPRVQYNPINWQPVSVVYDGDPCLSSSCTHATTNQAVSAIATGVDQGKGYKDSFVVINKNTARASAALNNNFHHDSSSDAVAQRRGIRRIDHNKKLKEVMMIMRRKIKTMMAMIKQHHGLNSIMICIKK